ncbi:hypothetical protein IEQ34_026293 [Dendrobium chrysotoxum]|uniref:Uncharacterized protein n=1 Tax=Dendrobium chrysotoxum TaxID=161865 RepID=A0AAV7FIQ6_DENCH|nr:hypothetical protein IEQ34_026293 [Dendrobium chrysotoxum]
MSRYADLVSKKYAGWGLYRDSLVKDPDPEVIFKPIALWKKITISYSLEEKTEIAFSLWSDRATIT